MLALLTPTRGRPVGLAIAAHYVVRMAAGMEDVVWVICDGTGGPKIESAYMTGSVRTWHLKEDHAGLRKHESLSTNVERGIGFARRLGATMVAVIEDDDWYDRSYARWVMAELQGADLIGESYAMYYNVATRRCRQLPNANHASLCSSAWRLGTDVDRKVMRAIEESKRIETFLDLAIWQTCDGKLHNPCMCAPRRVVGMKGLPGITGIGMGHTPEALNVSDHNMDILRKLIGPDADRYADMYTG